MIGIWPQHFAPLGMFLIIQLQRVVKFRAQFVRMFVAQIEETSFLNLRYSIQ
jgi:hypothetical protein